MIVDSRAKEVIKRYVEHDVSYLFITPQIPKIEDVKSDINRLFGSKAEQRIKIKTIEEKQFQRSAVTDYIILNPEEDDTHPLHVFIELPIGSHGYRIEVDKLSAIEFVDRFNDPIGQS